jgi:preprotein translocase subunit YajC
MYATVVSLEDADVVLEVAPGVNVRYMRRAIMDVVPSDTGDIGHSDADVDGSGPAPGKKGKPADATGPGASEDGSATTS